jgi:hypothetical protein
VDFIPRPVNITTYDDISEEAFNKCMKLRKYLKICEKLLNNREKGVYKKLFEKARKIYATKKSVIEHDIEIHPEKYDFFPGSPFVSPLSFEGCLENEIKGRSLSFAGLAIAEAFYGIYNAEHSNEKLIVNPADLTGDGAFKGVPEAVFDKMLIK